MASTSSPLPSSADFQHDAGGGLVAPQGDGGHCRLAQALALGGGLNAVVNGVADDVQEGILHFLQDGACRRGCPLLLSPDPPVCLPAGPGHAPAGGKG